MQQLEFYHVAFLLLAILLEVLANVVLKYSNGFRRVGLGILSLGLVVGAFAALGQSIKGIDLSVAYALWGGIGIAATVLFGWILFNQKLNKKGWSGLTCLLLGMVLIKMA